MTGDSVLWLAGALCLVAFLYSAVGHAGASGYIAVLSLWGFQVNAIKPIALVLNILVASITTYQFWKAGFFSSRLFFPLAMLAVPLAFAGGYFSLPVLYLKPMIGSILLFSAVRFLYDPKDAENPSPPNLPVALVTGGSLGLLAGLTGTGGGIFLSPLMLLAKWAATKPTAAVSAAFILVNSVAGLLGNLASTKQIPPTIGAYLLAVFVGGTVGSYCGSRKFPAAWIKRALGLVLTIAGFKLILG